MTTTSTRTAKTRRTPNAGDTAAVAAVTTAARTLGLPTVRDRLDEHLATAEREHLTYAGFLADLPGVEWRRPRRPTPPPPSPRSRLPPTKTVGTVRL